MALGGVRDEAGDSRPQTDLYRIDARKILQNMTKPG